MVTDRLYCIDEPKIPVSSIPFDALIAIVIEDFAGFHGSKNGTSKTTIIDTTILGLAEVRKFARAMHMHHAERLVFHHKVPDRKYSIIR